MTDVPERLRRQVRERAHGYCEYCLMPDTVANLPHEPDHLIAEKHGGSTTFDNLAWACFFCNRHKGSDIASIDTQTGRIVELFNPRKQQWKRHFHLNGPRIDGITASGRATAALLQFNLQQRIGDRLNLITTGHYPPG